MRREPLSNTVIPSSALTASSNIVFNENNSTNTSYVPIYTKGASSSEFELKFKDINTFNITDSGDTNQCNLIVNENKDIYCIPGPYNNGSTIAIGNGISESFASFDSIIIGNKSNATNNYAVAIGLECIANGTDSVSIGHGSNAYENNSISIGRSASCRDVGAISIGISSTAKDMRTISIGYGASAYVGDSISIGPYSNAHGAGVSIGSYAKAYSSGAISIGCASKAYELDSISIGSESNAYKHRAISIGHCCNAYGMCGVSIGYQSNAYANCISIGYDSNTYKDGCISIGVGSNTYEHGGISMGYMACSSNKYAIAIGYVSNANDYYSITVGNHVFVSGTGVQNNIYGIAVGNSTNCYGHTLTIGNSNNIQTDYSISIGSNQHLESPSNYYNITIGNNITTNGGGSIIMGYDNSHTASDQILIGNANKYASGQSIVIGHNNYYVNNSINIVRGVTHISGNGNAPYNNYTSYSVIIGGDFTTNNYKGETQPPNINYYSTVLGYGNYTDCIRETIAIGSKNNLYNQYKTTIVGSNNYVYDYYNKYNRNLIFGNNNHIVYQSDYSSDKMQDLVIIGNNININPSGNLNIDVLLHGHNSYTQNEYRYFYFGCATGDVDGGSVGEPIFGVEVYDVSGNRIADKCYHINLTTVGRLTNALDIGELGPNKYSQ